VSIRIGSDEFPEFDMEHCKGCGICANECPQNKKLEREKSENRAIKMVLEE
jgi:Pyruvate/2-oxoacid:ferredoxin oxidoreductase delta subunit